MTDTKKAAETYAEAISDAHNYTNWIVSQFEPFLGRSTLEIGVAHGSYIRRLSAGREYAGLDLDSEAVTVAQKQHPRHQFYCADLGSADFSERVPRRFESIVCCNVLEHIHDDSRALQNLSNALTPGGHLLLFVPALPWLYSDLDRLAGHHRRYTRAAVRRLVTGVGLAVVQLRYFNPVGAVGWWLNRGMRHRTLNGDAVNAQVRAFDRWGVPVSRALDPFFRNVLGQSLICVARRP
jgi:SAM-dependent methyltransferase